MKILLALIMVMSLGIVSCVSPGQQESAAAGALVGAGSGAVIGNQFGPRGWAKGALIGATLGGAMGLNYGQNQDRINSMNNTQTYNQPGPQMRPMGMGMNNTGGPNILANPYRAPNPQNCAGRWEWSPMKSYWVCR